MSVAWFQTLLASGISDPFTNGNNQQGFLLIGDSTTAYATDNIAGPTPDANTVYEFNGTSIVQVGSTDLINAGFAGTGKGSPWPRFGINYYTATGKKPVFCDGHVFNSSVILSSDTSLAWLYDSTNYFKGTCYTNMKTKADNCLSALGVSRFKGIFIFLAVNDVKDALFSASVINTGYNNIITYLQQDFPDSPIYLVAPANISTSTTQTALQADVRWHIIKTVPTLFTGVKCAYYAQYGQSLNLQSGAHFNSTFNNYEGASLDLFIRDEEVDDDVRLVTNHFASPISAAHKAAWKTAITDLKTEGFWQVCNYLKMDIASAAANEPFNVTGITQPIAVEGTAYQFFANDCIQTGNNGANSWNSIGFVPSLHTKYGDVNDQICMDYVQSDLSGLVNATLFASGTAGWRLQKNAAGATIYNASDANSTVVVTGLFAQNWWGVSRPDSATKEVRENSTVRNTLSLGGAVLNTGRMSRGGGQGGSLMNAKHEGFFVAKLSGYTLSNVITILNTLRTALKS